MRHSVQQLESREVVNTTNHVTLQPLASSRIASEL